MLLTYSGYYTKMIYLCTTDLLLTICVATVRPRIYVHDIRIRDNKTVLNMCDLMQICAVRPCTVCDYGVTGVYINLDYRFQATTLDQLRAIRASMVDESGYIQPVEMYDIISQIMSNAY
jgi:hypothetical protein